MIDRIIAVYNRKFFEHNKAVVKSCLVLLLVLSGNLMLLAQQNQVELVVEQLADNEAYDVKGGSECQPGDIVITIKSDVNNLIFDSNVIDIKSVTHDEKKGEYVFCHSKESFWLTVGSAKHISKKVYIDGLRQKYAFKVVEKAAIGKVYFKTIPNNALADFGFAGQSPQLTGVPVEMNSGEYKVRISKHGFIPVDTFVVVPSDGNIKQLDIMLKPDFAKVQLDIKTSDNSMFQIPPQITIDTININMAELYNNTRVRSFDDPSNLQYFKLYIGGVIPVPPGSYSVTVNSPGFRTFTTRIAAVKGSLTSLTAKLTPICGYITVIDDENATDAKIYMDDEYIGDIPLFKYKSRIGNHKIRIEKDGFVSSEKEYRVLSEEDREIDLNIKMSIFKQYRIESEPYGAEIFIDGQREGFSPRVISLNKGNHEIRVRKNGYLDFRKKVNIDQDRTLSLDTIKCILEQTVPLKITSDGNNMSILMMRQNDTVVSELNIPAEIRLPKGKYKLQLFDPKGYKTFNGNINHNGEKDISVPAFSKGTFTTLVGEYFYQQPQTTTENKNNCYNLMATAQFGRFNLCPGLSTSLLKGTAFKVSELYKGRKDSIDIDKEKVYDKYVFALTGMFLNGEFRVGVPILKNLDIAAVGAYSYYPSLKKYLPMTHASGQEMFFGIEISSRISFLNVNVKFGQENYNGNFNYYLPIERVADIKSNDFQSEKFSLKNYVITVGFTLGQSVSHNNNMLRILKKPLITGY